MLVAQYSFNNLIELFMLEPASIYNLYLELKFGEIERFIFNVINLSKPGGLEL